ncbi:uncharacterized protein LOC123698178 [Colias croceus]|uniref:uncharacterized protein LOC123698178 n=1 Tax=Colias crocea TaxID=72248 RepID=UPI001E27DF21|nr:uncharacterized protein LOC123698178 [Colias croceus]
MSLDEAVFNSEMRAVWSCPDCVRAIPKSSKNDSTPVRNITTTRGSKRQALNSPPIDKSMSSFTRNDIREVVEDVIKSTMADIFSTMQDNLMSAINKELKPIRLELATITDSINFISNQYDEMKKDYEISKVKLTDLEKQNTILNNTIEDLCVRINQTEQQLRQNNIELQCVPERKNENLIDIVAHLGNILGCDLSSDNVLHCTRTAKTKTENPRPRSIVVQLSSVRLRDQVIAAVSKFNKENPQSKLNTAHVGLTGNSPIFVNEHLSPANKSLHAATRIKAKEKGYKFTWIRNGKIFIRKNEGSQYIQVKNKISLDNLI